MVRQVGSLSQLFSNLWVVLKQSYILAKRVLNSNLCSTWHDRLNWPFSIKYHVCQCCNGNTNWGFCQLGTSTCRCKQRHSPELGLWLQILEFLLSEWLWGGFWSSWVSGAPAPPPSSYTARERQIFLSQNAPKKHSIFLRKLRFFDTTTRLPPLFDLGTQEGSLTSEKSEKLYMLLIEGRELRNWKQKFQVLHIISQIHL